MSNWHCLAMERNGDELKSHIYDCSSLKQIDQWVKTAIEIVEFNA
jgi:hypothetical protein